MARTLSFLVVLCFGFGSTEVLYAQTPPLFDSSPVEEGTFNSGYLYEITSSDIEDNDRNIFLSSGSLPAGLILQDNGDGTASISGIPSETGDFPLELTVEETTGSPPQSGTQAFTLTINKALATINLDDLVQTFDGNPKSVSATTVPNGLGTLSFTYDGSPTAPTNAGDYTVEATLVNPNYEGSAIGILTVGKARATINLSDLVQTFDGNPKPVSATTVPSDLETLSITYDGSPTAPTNAGDYTVEATLVNPNYEGSAIGILTVSKATATINLSDLVQTFDGNPKPVSATTVPSDLETLSFTYNGSPTAPIDAGDYTVEATLTNANYAGMASGTLTINKAIASVSISNLNQNFDGDPKPVVVTTDPANLNVMVTYDGSALVPSAPGTYSVFALIDEINYEGSNNATL
ncbi:MAG: MBG domain-containing protein, partial [Bacteroidota bacterium]